MYKNMWILYVLKIGEYCMYQNMCIMYVLKMREYCMYWKYFNTVCIKNTWIMSVLCNENTWIMYV
jgi:hypothetical protein